VQISNPGKRDGGGESGQARGKRFLNLSSSMTERKEKGKRREATGVFSALAIRGGERGEGGKRRNQRKTGNTSASMTAAKGKGRSYGLYGERGRENREGKTPYFRPF